MMSTTTGPQRRSVVVRLSQKAYDELTAKAKAHDQYLRATQKMRERQAEILAYPADLSKWTAVEASRRTGYLDCLREFGAAVVNAGMQDNPLD